MQRGYTLIEFAVACAILAVLLAAAARYSLGARPASLHAAILQADALTAQARAVAQTSGNGATLLVVPQAQGVSVTLYAGRPDGRPMSATGAPPLVLNLEADGGSLGKPPFAVFFSSSGSATGSPRYPQGAFDPANPPLLPSQPPCPDQGRQAVILTFESAGRSESLTLPCAASGTP
ncbi:MAG: prepilin-type N-terminal cleavage/methylation domain-containing protein [Candidatus Eremiobacteraeota bacterium]|nr:prepilin-type N-terminal cleavage/methylation domain-containing protein [Candidatus Eremiobacteraeota bacterium]